MRRCRLRWTQRGGGGAARAESGSHEGGKGGEAGLGVLTYLYKHALPRPTPPHPAPHLLICVPFLCPLRLAPRTTCLPRSVRTAPTTASLTCGPSAAYSMSYAPSGGWLAGVQGGGWLAGWCTGWRVAVCCAGYAPSDGWLGGVQVKTHSPCPHPLSCPPPPLSARHVFGSLTPLPPPFVCKACLWISPPPPLLIILAPLPSFHARQACV